MKLTFERGRFKLFTQLNPGGETYRYALQHDDLEIASALHFFPRQIYFGTNKRTNTLPTRAVIDLLIGVLNNEHYPETLEAELRRLVDRLLVEQYGDSAPMKVA